MVHVVHLLSSDPRPNVERKSKKPQTRDAPEPSIDVDVPAAAPIDFQGDSKRELWLLKDQKDSLSWQNVLGWERLSEKSRCANCICLQLVTVERRKVTYIVHAT